MEALARWRHPRLGLLAPSAFISLAEDTGLIGAISQQVMDQACQAARGWPAGVRLSINVSPGQFSDPSLVDRVAGSLRRAGLSPHRLSVEVTESAMVTRSATTALAALRDLGVEITIDDFGTGYSSFETMKLLRPSTMKVDRSFVAALDGPEPASARAMLRAFVSLAAALDMTTVAEGAETPEQRAALRELGFHYSQGFIDARPAGVHDLSFTAR
jgi:EAL domain-containing protein (putative c-di-GMP-specific phosphodiesterase class I)